MEGLKGEFINLTEENLMSEHLCCIIRSRKADEGVEAKEKGASGVCMLGAKKQKAWLTDQSFAKKFGFKTADYTDSGYELLALSFDGSVPKFNDGAREVKIHDESLTIYYDVQCPYTVKAVKAVKDHCEKNGVPLSLIKVDTLKKAKEVPGIFNNWAVFYKGRFETVNLLLDLKVLDRILKRS